MQLRELVDALSFLQRIYVGKGDEERLMRTVRALEQEIAKQRQAVRTSSV